MYIMLAFVLITAPDVAFAPFDSLAECEDAKPRAILALQKMGAVAYALACVPLVKMEGV